ncbi:EF-hand domain-containing protein [Variovorax terrae]|uniref:EF-hand domain-containing protein n=1 Tax=Variovorax terrae TaxID=2923278 RepID=A0A9X2ARF4_9BURK|nr:EF-hand domain-containing protein [Variovorax terrae]MCJ0765592.1 EF-hand domain-containing protein [Variovorax terrae]
MKAKRRCIPNFEARSVMLFTAWAFGSALNVYAQAPDASSSPASPARPVAQMSQPADGQAAPAQKGKWSAKDVDAAFARADANKDGKISREEAQRFPAVAQRFDQVDLDHDGALSRAEFDQALKP